MHPDTFSSYRHDAKVFGMNFEKQVRQQGVQAVGLIGLTYAVGVG
jgi:hypothetical protein